ncbi:MAG: hypothetical protein FWH23_06135 [Bacteroidales bacterium]|nr:hypothetical protein [Bacteroidales bacterium]MCL2133869.1 hypothetical protein [Bacteroidales bacterium]
MKVIKKIALLLTCLLFALFTCAISTNCSSNNDNTPEELPESIVGALDVANPAHVNWYGRTYQNTGEQGVYFNNTISGFELRFTGTALEAEIYASATCYIVVYLDGVNYPEFCHRLKLNSGTHSYTLASGLVNKLHTVKVLRSTENTEANKTRLISLSIDGTFYVPPTKPERKIEFYGASSISGHGSIGQPGAAYSIDNSCGAHTMGHYAAYRLGAQINVMSASGWGLGVGTVKSIPAVSDKYSNTDTKLWDFNLYEPDVTLLNLGYNDCKQLGTKGTPVYEQNKQVFKENLKQFIELIRSRHPNTYIYITCGIYQDSYEEEAYTFNTEVLNEMQSVGIQRVKVLRFSPMTSSESGANNHPGWTAHKRMGKSISDNIAQELGWNIIME